MATRTIYIKDAYVAEMIEVFGHDYLTDLPDGQGGTYPNPETKAQYAGRRLDLGVKHYISLRVQSYRKANATPIDDTEIVEDILAPTTTTTTIAPTTTTTTT